MSEPTSDIGAGAQWRLTHTRVVDASAKRTWAAVEAVRYGDLWVTRPLMMARHLGSPGLSATDRLLTQGPLPLLHCDPPHSAVAGMIAQPWRPRSARRPATTLREVREFADPGWVKVLTDFKVRPLESSCSVLSTTTWVWPTDAGSARAFGVYWMALRPFLGMVRRDVLRAVARRAQSPCPDR